MSGTYKILAVAYLPPKHKKKTPKKKKAPKKNKPKMKTAVQNDVPTAKSAKGEPKKKKAAAKKPKRTIEAAKGTTVNIVKLDIKKGEHVLIKKNEGQVYVDELHLHKGGTLEIEGSHSCLTNPSSDDLIYFKSVNIEKDSTVISKPKADKKPSKK